LRPWTVTLVLESRSSRGRDRPPAKRQRQGHRLITSLPRSRNCTTDRRGRGRVAPAGRTSTHAPGRAAFPWPAVSPSPASTSGGAMPPPLNNAAGTRSCCQQTDQPVAALLSDLAQRGLLESTLVFWGGELGPRPGIRSRTSRPK